MRNPTTLLLIIFFFIVKKKDQRRLLHWMLHFSICCHSLYHSPIDTKCISELFLVIRHSQQVHIQLYPAFHSVKGLCDLCASAVCMMACDVWIKTQASPSKHILYLHLHLWHLAHKRVTKVFCRSLGQGRREPSVEKPWWRVQYGSMKTRILF